MDGHLTADELTAWVGGALAAADRDRVMGHVADCGACRQAASALARLEPTGLGVASTETLAPGDRVPLAVESSIGRFRVERVLGRGGMGVVVAARDPLLDREVAIKVLPASADGDELLALEARLVREARALAALRHPNLVAIHEAGRDGDRLFLVMELVQGMSLRRWLEARRPAWRDALRACLDAGRGVVALHAAGIVHRDLKPDNVLVADDGRVVVADLGLALRDRAAATTADGLTSTGKIVGTPRYMAPEQLAGEPVDARADQWAFATLTLEALRVHGTDAAPARVRAALARAMDPAPAARFPSVAALCEALAQASRPARGRIAVAAGTGAVAIAAVVVGLAWPAGSTAPAATAPAAATAPVTTAAPAATASAPAPIATTPVAETPAAAAVAQPGPRPGRPGAATAPAHAKPAADPPIDGADPKTIRTVIDRVVAGGSARRTTIRRDEGTMLSAACDFPNADDTKPSGTLDWGPVIRRELVEATRYERAVTMLLYEVKGQRGDYAFDGLDNGVILDAEVGALVALCPDQVMLPETYQVPAAWKGPVWITHGAAPLAREPEVAGRTPRPRYLHDVHGYREPWTLAAGTLILTRATLPGPGADGRHDMGGWMLEIPDGTPGADRFGPKRGLPWVIAAYVELVPDRHGDDVPLLRAVELLDHLLQ